MHEGRTTDSLLKNIITYLSYLEKNVDLSVSIYFSTSKLREMPEDHLKVLLPYNVHKNLYCTMVKKQYWQKCMQRQQDILCRTLGDAENSCDCLECYAGVREYLFRICVKGQIIGDVVVTGYRGSTPPEDCINQQTWESRLKEKTPPKELLDAVIPPLCRMLEMLFSETSETPVQGEYNLILHFLQECNGQVSLEDLCRQFGRSKSYLSHMFNPKHGMSLPNYCNELKLRYSRELLSETSIPIAEIATDVGYRDVSYFVSKFREKFGITPLQYRKLRNNKVEDTNKVRFIAGFFSIPGELKEVRPLGNGHINDTSLLIFNDQGTDRKYVLQRINKSIFLHPEELMENIVGVTGFIREQVVARGGDPDREVLNVLRTSNGASFYKDEDGEYWRITKFIDKTISYDKAEDPESFSLCGRAYGGFQRILAAYPAEKLHETIPGFHNTRERYRRFEQAVEQNLSGRAANCRKEIDYLRSRRELAEFAMANNEAGRLPLRVTHNDTKLNNILVDEATGKALCILDLDTVMPGFSIYDFGDAIRSGACTAVEDEQDLSRVHCDFELYEAFTRGFLEGAENSLTDFEVESLPMGAICITYEQALRFLTDYIEGDPYYKTEYPEHNLVRTRAQIRMVQEMEENRDRIRKILRNARNFPKIRNKTA